MSRRRLLPIFALAIVLSAPRLHPAGAEDSAPAKPPAAPAAPVVKPAKPPTPEQAADSVLAAIGSKDDAALKALSGKDVPDAWLVADELIRRGQHDAADAFAKASPRLDTEKLPAYVASRRGRPDDRDRRARVAAANAALATGSPQAVLDAVGAPESSPSRDIFGARLEYWRGLALAALHRWGESSAAFLAAADAAEAIGWLARARDAAVRAGWAADSASAFRVAVAAFERALAVMEALGDRAGAATTRAQIGNEYFALGDYAKGLASFQRALAAFEALGDTARAATTLSNIGSVHCELGDYAEALATQERALAAMDALGDKAEAARTLGNIGNVYSKVGNYAKALETYERALAAMEALGGRAGAAMTLGNIANVYGLRGDHAKALATHERALAAKEALGDRAGAAATLGNIASVYWSLGDNARALAIFERALAESEALGDEAGIAMTLGNLANVYDSLGDHAKALATYERALAAKEALGDRAGAATTLGNIGDVRSVMGDYAKAIAICARALAAQEALGDRAGATRTRIGIGRSHLRLGEVREAIAVLDAAVHEADRLRSAALRASALTVLAEARLASGDAHGAVEAAREAVGELGTIVGGLGDEQGAAARAEYAGLFAVGAGASAKSNDARGVAFFLESGRAGSLLEALGGRPSMRDAAIPEELRAAAAKAQAKETAALKSYQLAVDGPDLEASRVARKALDEAKDRVRDVVEQIQRAAKRAAAVWYPRAAPLDDVQTRLSDGDSLVLYGVLGDDALALVVTRVDAKIVALGRSSAIREACEALDAADPSEDPETALDRLRALLLRPLGVEKATRLLVSPEGPLCYVPFSALATDKPIALVPSGTLYGPLLDVEGKKRGDGVLAVGNPDYAAARDATASATYERGSRLSPLPGTRDECKAVGDVVLLGAKASEGGLATSIRERPRWRAVHLACHGIVDPERPTLSSLALTPDATSDGFLTALEVFDSDVPADLVVLSACETGKGKIVNGEGIVGLTRAFMFAGAPRVICSLWKVDDEATRALMMKFYELWNPRAGEAAAGTLSRPGAPGGASGASKGPKTGSKPMGTAEALRAAQEFVRSHAKWKHPYYWAAWVLWGLPD